MDIISSSKSKVLLSFIILCLYVPSVCYIFNGNEIIDLESSLPSEFIHDISRWTLNNKTTNYNYSVCNNTPIFPAYGVVGSKADIQRVYTVLGNHNTLWIYVKLWMIGEWTSQDSFFFNIGNRVDDVFTIGYKLIKAPFDNSTWLPSICNNSITTYILPVSIHIITPHTGQLLKLQFGSYISNSRTFYGVRELKVLLKTTTSPPVKGCGTTLNTGQIWPASTMFSNCSCPSGLLSANSSCIECDPGCDKCYGAGADHCGTCKAKYLFNGTHCIPNCSFPCQTCSGPELNNCLSCVPGYFLNSSSFECIFECNLPNIKRQSLDGINYCDTVVNNETSCSLDPKSCSSIIPCNTLNFLYKDGSCLPYCNPPRKSKTNMSGIFCEDPCSNPNYYYDPEGQICLSACKRPYSAVNTDKYLACLLQISPNDNEEVTKVSSASNLAGFITNILITVSAVISSGDPSGISSLMLAKLLQYIKFLDIYYPIRLELMFRKSKSTAGAIIPGLKMNDEFKSKFELKSIPYNFAKYSLHSEFLVNFWDSLITLTTFFGVYFLLFLIERIASKTKLHPPIKQVRLLAQNFVIMEIYNCSGDVALFSGLAIPRTTIKMPPGCLSLFVALFFIAIELTLFLIHFRILYQYQSLRQKKRRTSNRIIEDFETKNEGFKVLFETFKTNSFLHQSFLLLLVIKGVLFNLTLVCLFDHPLIQVVIFLILSFSMCGYITVTRSYRKAVNWLQHLTYEIILLVVNISILIMAIQDNNQSSPTSSTVTLGEIIIICSLIFSFLPSVFLVIKIILAVRDFLIERKLNNKKTNAEKTSYELPQRDNTTKEDYLSQPNIRTAAPNSKINPRSTNLKNLGHRSYIEMNTQTEGQPTEQASNKPSLDSSGLFPLNDNSFVDDLQSSKKMERK